MTDARDRHIRPHSRARKGHPATFLCLCHGLEVECPRYWLPYWSDWLCKQGFFSACRYFIRIREGRRNAPVVGVRSTVGIEAQPHMEEVMLP